MPVYRKQVSLLILVGLAGWAALRWFQLIDTILEYYNPLPITDYWHVVTSLKDIEGLHLRFLWEQHNDHRIVFPEFVFATDVLVFRGLHILPLVSSFICYTGMWVIVAWALLSDPNCSLTFRTVTLLLAGLVLAWRGCAQVLGVPFLLQWTLLQFMVLAAFALISLAKYRQKLVYLAGAISCAVIANYSAINGLLLWPILLLAGWVLRLSRTWLLVLATAAAISCATFFVGYHSTGSVNLQNFLIYPAYSFEFLLSYLSVPFGLVDSSSVGIVFGVVSLVGFALLSVLAARSRLLSLPPGIVLFGSYLFTLSTAVLIAAGRMDPSDPSFISAKAERYVSIPVVTWAILITAALWVTYRLQHKLIYYGLILITIALLLKALPRTRVWVQSHDNLIREQQWATLSIEAGVFDEELVRKVYPDPNLPHIFLPLLRKYHLSIYSLPYSKWLGLPVSSIFRALTPRGGGQVTQIFPLNGGLEVLGWASDVARETYSPKIVFVNDLGQIVGIGRRLKLGLPEHIASFDTPSSIAWVGFLEQVDKSKSFLSYVVDRRTSALTPIGNVIRFPTIAAAGTGDFGDPIAGAAWNANPAWTRNLLPRHLDTGIGPSEFFASWSGSDSNTGSLSSAAVQVPANHCIVLPVLHGPVADRLSARIVNAGTNEPMATIPLQGAGTHWRYWRIPFDSAVKEFRIIAEDQGRSWGEWLAVGTPRQCR